MAKEWISCLAHLFTTRHDQKIFKTMLRENSGIEQRVNKLITQYQTEEEEDRRSRVIQN